MRNRTPVRADAELCGRTESWRVSADSGFRLYFACYLPGCGGSGIAAGTGRRVRWSRPGARFVYRRTESHQLCHDFFFTTGGIRGGKKKMDKFYPRSFNMGVRADVYKALGGFSRMRFGEDIDFSIRIFKGGYRCRLFPEAWVWHKRRTDLKKFSSRYTIPALPVLTCTRNIRNR